ncbi:YdeI family protein [uncultured Alsobacter sp.]|uniref:YdeI/OmpD-associated family protein n=1 Tax=uncultured Alsobacter sp. TaxID=1748258 RepID=UPI0025F84961|nr:YdeI/OmpD-associated family protein [uncultured Alsobacter sp.]
MPDPDPSKILPFASPADLRQWLRANHAVARELWVKVYKNGAGVSSVSWEEIVIETLCWGWIDGIKKSHDDRAYLQRITPRNARSVWSKRNTEHAERLIAEGRMEEPGLAQVRAAKADGRWANAYAPVSEMTVPDDFLAALDGRPEARRFFEGLPKSGRFVIAYGLTSAKKPETRQRRFEKFLDMMRRGERPDGGPAASTELDAGTSQVRSPRGSARG